MRVAPLPSSAATAVPRAVHGPSSAGAAPACARGASRPPGRAVAVLVIALLAAGLAGCEAPPPRHPPYRARVAPAPAPEVVTEVIAYPSQGQSEQQLDRDRYECHQWAVKQTGFDPSVPGVPPRQQVRVVRAPEPPPGAAVVGGALTGAVLGAVVASHGDEAGGAVVGAIAGGAVGAVAESARAEEHRRDDETITERRGGRNAAHDEQAGAYRRAISACLEGRGYSVR